MNELRGSNVANGFYVVGNTSGENLQELVSRSESSDSNRNVEQELDDFDLHTFRNTLEVDSNIFGVSDNSTPMEHSPEVGSVDVSGSVSGMRVRKGYVRPECVESSQGKKRKRA
jgi:hypothetical protein